MDKIIFLFYFVIPIGISLFVVLYFKIIKKALKEYKKSVSFLDDIIFSFNKDVKSTNDKMIQISKDVEKTSQDIVEIKKSLLTKTDFDDLESVKLIKSEENILEEIFLLKESVTQFSAKYDEIVNRLTILESLDIGSIYQEKNLKTTSKLVKQGILGPLTNTEHTILDILSQQGEKSAPEIQHELKLSREHTSRLMKSMYSRGYVERKTIKMPYTYFLKKELENLMQPDK
jgi:hypothetical protein